MLHSTWVWHEREGICQDGGKHPHSVPGWSRRAAPHHNAGEDQPSVNTWVRELQNPTCSQHQLRSQGMSQTPQPCTAWGDLRGPAGLSPRPSASIPLCRHVQQVLDDLHGVVCAWPALVFNDLVPLRFLPCKWRDGKSLASSNSQPDSTRSEGNEGV